MALDNIPTLGPGGFNGNLDKVLVHKNGGSEVACSLLTLTNSALNPAGLYLDTVNQRVGIGTTTPTSLLDVVRYTTGSVDNAYQFRILNSADGLYPYSVLLLEHNNRTGIGNQGGAAIVIKDGFANVHRAGIGFDYFNSGSYSSAGGNLRLSNDGQGNLLLSTAGVDALRIFKDQGVQIGGVSTNLSSIARLHIKGSGSTSATTSLFVQNSSGTEIANFRDDLRVSVRNEFRVLDSAGNNAMIMFGDGYGDVRTLWVNGSLGVGVLGNNASASLQVDSTTQGFLPPRMTSAQKNLIASPAAGLMVYDTDLNRPCFYSGSAWVTL